MTKTIRLVDTTLREGEQTPGVHFTLAHKQQIVEHLVSLGVHEIELGIASPLFEEITALVVHCRRKYPGHRFSLWSRCADADIRFAARIGVEIISLSIPVSDIHLEQKLGKDREWAMENLKKGVKLARKLGMKVAVGFEDATRADASFLSDMALQAELCGALRIRIADTVGVSTPLTMSSLVAGLVEKLSFAEVGVHTHNDFGMAVGNAVAALDSGGLWVDGAVLGLGERAGCASLEQLVGYLALARGEEGLHLEHLKPLVHFVAGVTGDTVGPRTPILGEAIFTCESGLHLQGLMNEPATYEPFAPDKVGAERRLLIGAKAGKAAIVRQLTLLGREPAGKHAEEKYVQAVRRTAMRLGRALSSEELLAVCSSG